jgi:hypothetical protein
MNHLSGVVSGLSHLILHARSRDANPLTSSGADGCAARSQAIVLRGGATGFGAKGKWDGQFLLDHALPIKSFRVRRSKYHDGVYHFNNRVRPFSALRISTHSVRGGEGRASVYPSVVYAPAVCAVLDCKLVKRRQSH